MKIDSALLDKYFKGQCSDAEQAVVEAYFDGRRTPELDVMMKQAWEETVTGTTRNPLIIKRSWYAAAAAVLALGITLGWAWQRKPATRLAAAPAWDTIYNNSASAKRVELPDGSRILLSGFTRVIYRPENVREVWMKGEAFFEVEGSVQHPFLVHTDALTTTVLGTSFNISTGNRANGSIEVSLVRGKVAVKVEDGMVSFTQTLVPGQMISYRKGKMPSAPGRFSHQEVLDWKAGKLVFENTSLEDAFARIESRFGCRVEVGNKRLLQKKVSAVFSAGTSPDQVLSSLGYVHQFSFIKKEHQIYIVGK